GAPTSGVSRRLPGREATLGGGAESRPARCGAPGPGQYRTAPRGVRLDREDAAHADGSRSAITGPPAARRRAGATRHERVAAAGTVASGVRGQRVARTEDAPVGDPGVRRDVAGRGKEGREARGALSGADFASVRSVACVDPGFAESGAAGIG